MARIFYNGDINIEHGGYFYSLENWKYDYVDAVRVTPCGDADAADNCYWVERLSVNLRKGKDLDTVLSCIGQSVADLPKGAARRHILVDAHIAYGAYDCDSQTVQLGAKQSEYGEPIRADIVLRGNASIKRYARRVMGE